MAKEKNYGERKYMQPSVKCCFFKGSSQLYSLSAAVVNFIQAKTAATDEQRSIYWHFGFSKQNGHINCYINRHYVLPDKVNLHNLNLFMCNPYQDASFFHQQIMDA